MKKIIFLALSVLFYQFSTAQAYEGLIDYNKKSQPAVLIDYKYPQETVEKILKDKLERLGLKVKSSKGFLVVYNAVISSISSTAMDYAFQVDRKSKREKDIIVISMLMNVGEASTTAENSTNAKTFLNELAPAIEGLNTDNMINEQYQSLSKAQKKYKNLQDDQASLEKKIRNLQDELSKNGRDQIDQLNEVKRQEEILETLKTKKAGK